MFYIFCADHRKYTARVNFHSGVDVCQNCSKHKRFFIPKLRQQLLLSSFSFDIFRQRITTSHLNQIEKQRKGNQPNNSERYFIKIIWSWGEGWKHYKSGKHFEVFFKKANSKVLFGS